MRQTERGLTDAEAAVRLGQVGENRLTGRQGPGIASMFFSQFKDVMILILAAATLISLLMGQGSEAVTIIIIVLMLSLIHILPCRSLHRRGADMSLCCFDNGAQCLGTGHP